MTRLLVLLGEFALAVFMLLLAIALMPVQAAAFLYCAVLKSWRAGTEWWQMAVDWLHK